MTIDGKPFPFYTGLRFQADWLKANLRPESVIEYWDTEVVLSKPITYDVLMSFANQHCTGGIADKLAAL